MMEQPTQEELATRGYTLPAWRWTMVHPADDTIGGLIRTMPDAMNRDPYRYPAWLPERHPADNPTAPPLNPTIVDERGG